LSPINPVGAVDLFTLSASHHRRISDQLRRFDGLSTVCQSSGFRVGRSLCPYAAAWLPQRGILTQYAALVLIFLLIGAIYKNITVWHIGFRGENASGGTAMSSLL
jgi:hypothetical protein